jgi:hypothetical protein
VVGLKAVSTRQAIQQEVCKLELDVNELIQWSIVPLRLLLRVVQVE